MEHFQHATDKAVFHMTSFKTGQPRSGTIGSDRDANNADDVQGQIGLRLRAIYESVVAEPVPDRFIALLESLDCCNRKKM